MTDRDPARAPSVRLREIDLSTAADAELLAVLATESACIAADRPAWTPPSDAERLAGLRRTGSTRRRLVVAEAAAGGEAGAASGVVGETLVLLTTDHEVDRGWVSVRVHPDHRGRGIGTALADAANGVVREEGRRLVATEVIGSQDAVAVGRAFAERRGLHLSHTETSRRLALPVPATVLDPLRPAPPDRIETYTGGVPDAYAADVARMLAAVDVESPTGELEAEAAPYPVEEYRADHARWAALGQRVVESIAVTPDGRAVAVSQVLLGAEPADVAVQLVTLVDREHRGRRLGLATKIANLDHLAAHAPERTMLRTWNVDANEPVLRLNRALGFEPFEWMAVLVGPVQTSPDHGEQPAGT